MTVRQEGQRIPTVPEALTLARQCRRSGDLGRAEQLCRLILRAEPTNARALYLLGAACHGLAKPDEALRYFDKILRSRPESARAHHARGSVLRDQGELAESAHSFQAAVRLRPGFVAAQISLGLVLQTQGKKEEAAVCFREVLRLRPDLPEAHLAVGSILEAQGKLDEAAACYRESLRRNPDCAAAHNNLAALLLKQGRVVEAAASIEKAILLQPDCAEAHLNQGNIFHRQKHLDQAIDCYQRAIRLQPGSALAYNALGTTLVADEHQEVAGDCFRQALRLQPTLTQARTNLGHLLLQEGRRQKAVDQFREALRHDPTCSQALAAVAFHGLYSLTEVEVNRIRTLLADPQLAPDDRARLHFGLAHICDRAKAYDEAFAHFRQANALRRRASQEAGKAFDAEKHRARVDRIIATCDAAYFRRVGGLGRDTERPVFIVGMPRSGTTLVEQILSSHPDVFGAGELKDISRLSKRVPSRPGAADRYPDSLARLDEAAASTLADQYLQHIDKLAGTATRVIDKMPNNYLHLGLIAALFPRARVIHCRRDPMDVCFSCYVQDFQDWTSDQGDLARYYWEYERLMKHWRLVLPLPVLEVVYEELVEDSEAIIRELVSFCGLDWDHRCLAHHENPRAVRTPSLLQVRQPVYKSSVGRWRHYAAHLQPLLEALGRGPVAHLTD